MRTFYYALLFFLHGVICTGLADFLIFIEIKGFCFMEDTNKSKNELIKELNEMRKKIAQLESDKGLQAHESVKESLHKKVLGIEDDIEELELIDIIDIPAIQALINSFHKLVHITMAIVDLKGNVLVGIGWSDICTRFHRINPETCRHCTESDTELSAGVPIGNYKLYKCKNNMWDVATPIMVGGRHIGNVFSGQFFFEDEPLDYEFFRSQARKRGFPEEEYIAALEAVPRLSRQSLNDIMDLFMMLALMISKLSYGNMKLARSLTERDTLVNSLQAAKEKYRGIFENAVEGIFRTTPDGAFLDANPAVARIFGYDSPDELMKSLTHVGTQLYVDIEARKKWISIIDQQDYTAFETEMRKKDGSTCWVRQCARAVINTDGETIYYEGFSEDITEHKKAEEELRQYRDHLEMLVEERTAQLMESENEYRAIFENTGTATLIFEEDTTISLVNTEFEKLFDYTKDEVEGKKSWRELVLKKDRERLLEYHRCRRIEPGAVPKNYELEVVNRAGHIKKVYITISMIPGTKKSVASMLDITPLKEAENALIENEALYRNLFENAAIGMFQSSIEGRFLRINKAFATMLGYESPEEVVTTITDTATQIHTDPRNRTELLAALEQQGWFYAEQPYFRKDGSIMIGKLAIRKVVKYDGTTAYLEGIVEDITEKEKIEAVLRETEEKFRFLFEKSVDPIVLIHEGKYVDCNEAAVRHLRCANREELIGLGPLDFSPEMQPDGRLSSEKAREIYDTTFRNGTNHFEWMRCTKTDEEIWLDISHTVIPIQGKQIIYTVWRDIDRRKQAEEELNKAHQRLSDIINFLPTQLWSSTGKEESLLGIKR